MGSVKSGEPVMSVLEAPLNTTARLRPMNAYQGHSCRYQLQTSGWLWAVMSLSLMVLGGWLLCLSLHSLDGWMALGIGAYGCGLLVVYRISLAQELVQVRQSWQLPRSITAQHGCQCGLFVRYLHDTPSTAQNVTPRSVSMLKSLQLSWYGQAKHHRHQLVQQGDSALLWFRHRFGNRGVYDVSQTAPALTVGHPLGLWRAHLSLPQAQVTVLPIVGQGNSHKLNQFLSQLFEQMAAPSSHPSPAQSQPNEGEDRLRPFLNGDNVSHIHWRVSARLKQLVVRQATAPENSHLHLHLDLQSDGSESLRERTISTVATLLNLAAERTEVRSGSCTICLSGPGMRHLSGPVNMLIEQLATCDPSAPTPQIEDSAVVVSMRPAPSNHPGLVWLDAQQWDTICQLPRIRSRLIHAANRDPSHNPAQILHKDGQ